MRLDHTHKPWMFFTVGVLVVSIAIYIFYSLRVAVPGGGTAVGIMFGVLALGLMIFAALLSVRKRFPIWRIGRAKIWMRAHLWLGFLALPMVLFHAAFHARGLLTGILMWLTVLVVVSGLVGAWIQHTLPSKMFREVRFETIYDQIGVVRGQLVAEADANAENVKQSLSPGVGVGSTVVLTMISIPELQNEIAEFEEFYAEEVRGYLGHEQGKVALRNREWSLERFETLRMIFPEAAWKPITAIEEICEEKRQLDHQARLHRVLHGWLLCHLPLSAALILLGCIHAIVAWRF